MYFVVVFLVNLYAQSSVPGGFRYSFYFCNPRWVVMEFLGVLQTGAASTLPLAIVLIGTCVYDLLQLRNCTHLVAPQAIQHLILSTQNLPSNNDTQFSSSQSGSHNKNRCQSGIVFGAADSGQTIELQSSLSMQSRMDDPKASRALTDQSSNPSKATLSDVTFAA